MSLKISFEVTLTGPPGRENLAHPYGMQNVLGLELKVYVQVVQHASPQECKNT